MSKSAPTHNPNPIGGFFSAFSGNGQLRLEKSRLEAFLAAYPGEYCGFANDGNVIYSQGFMEILGLEKIQTIHDIQNKLNASDAAALEGMFIRLQEENKKFSIEVENQEGTKNLKITGTIGESLSKIDVFHILWIEDMTQENTALQDLQKTHTALDKEFQQHSQILNHTPMPLWMRDGLTQLIWCNQAYADLFGSTPKMVVKAQQEFALNAPQKAKKKIKIPSAKEMAKAALTQGQMQQSEGYLITQGKRHYVSVTESPLEGTSHVMGTMRDITRQQELSLELNRYLAANKTLLEQLRTAIVIFDADQSLEFYNSAFSQLWGLEDLWLNNTPKLGDILEKLRETRRLPEQADFRNYKKSWLDMFTNLIEPHEDMLYLPDATALRMLVIPHPMGGLMMTFEDVTSRLELESSYNTLIAVQKETLDNLAEGVAVYGGDGRLKLCNPSFMELWHLNPEDMEGEPHISSLMDKTERLFMADKWKEKRQILISHGIERAVQEGRIARADHSLLEYTTVPLPDGGVLVSYFDVTDSVKVENALREKNAALEAAEELKTDFLANVSYQLRTPLNAIMGFAEILDNQYFGELNNKQKEYSQGIQDAGGKLVRLIDDILDLSTIEAGYLDLSMNEFGIQPMLETLYELTKDWALKQQIQVKLECPPDKKSMIADERRIKQVMLNLIHNAINFTPEKGEIIIGATRNDTHVILSVQDNGVGISKADQERIFEPFERAVIEHRADMSPTALSRGAGLGLSLVKNIVELHEGYVEIESEEDKGTTVKLYIPIEPALETLL